VTARYELLPPHIRFQVGDPDTGETVVIEAAGFETESRQLQTELDAQTTILRRVDAPTTRSKRS
jgi:hypothetical protein